jgi:hypothetical protein
LPLFEEDLNSVLDKVIQVYLDNTNIYKLAFIQNEISVSFRRFMQRLMRDCELPEKLFNPPMIIEGMFGKIDFDFKKFFGLGFLVS